MHKNRSVDTHRFAMIPSPEIPRSSFRIESTHKTTFDAGYLVPIYVEEVLPGDTFNVSATIFARLATPLFPLMDNLHLDTFFFFVPNRLVWRNWVKFMGQQDNPGESISYTIPQVASAVGGYAVGSLQDHMGLPTVGQVDPASSAQHSVLPLRAYNLIWNEWFRDQNLQDSVQVNRDSDGPDAATDYTLLRRGKRHDYFTSCLPWPQKGPAVGLPVGHYAPVIGRTDPGTGSMYPPTFQGGDGSSVGRLMTDGSKAVTAEVGYGAGTTPIYWDQPNLIADLSASTAATVNSIRQSFQVQKLMERDARGGTRYAEIVRAHFGVQSPDARLQRPEYLGGGSTPVSISPIAQTSGTPASDGTPLGTLGAMGTTVAQGHGFSQAFTEHGFVIGLCSVRADLTYQQGLRKMWSRQTRYDHYFPAFAHLGEQAVLQREIYFKGTSVDETVFGYQERWAEYRYQPSMITGLFKSTSAGTLDAWHLAQHFTAAPTLASTFIQDTPPVERIVAVGSAANGQQFIADCFFRAVAARPLPMYSVPGYLDRF